MESLELRNCGLAADGSMALTALLDPHWECRACDAWFGPGSARGQEETSRAAGAASERRYLEQECGSSCVVATCGHPSKPSTGAAESSEVAQRDGVCPLEELDVGCNALGAVPALFSAIGRLSKLRVLRLAHNKLGPRGCGMLCGALADARNGLPLGTLDISNNDVSDEGMTHVASVLPRLSALTSLYANDNTVGDRGVTKLCNVLEKCLHLRDLDLRANVITDEGERALSAMLRRRGAILRVDLCNNRIGPEGENWCF